MSADRGALTVVAPAAVPDDDRLDLAPRWPVTRLAGLSLMALLALGLLAPAAAAGGGTGRLVGLLLPAALAVIVARLSFEALDPRTVSGRIRTHLPAATLAAGLGTAVLTGAGAIDGLDVDPVRVAVTATAAGLVLVAAGTVRDLEVRLRLALRRVFFVGSETARGDLERELRRRSDAGFAGAATGAGGLERAVRSSQATVLVLDRDAMREPAVVEAARRLNLAGIHVRELVGYYESEFKKVPLAELTPTWFLFDIAAIHRRPVAAAARRAVELTLGALLLGLAAPVLLVAAVAVRATSPGPALFRQRRVGRGGEPFTLLKLRTMTVSGDGPAWAPAQLHRITPVGRVLRRFRLDELPQLWNLVRGELALIGPRPEQVAIAERLEAEIPFYGARHCIRPGLTGWAQVNLGYAGSLPGTIAKLQRDLYYIKHAGLRLDALILWMTLRTVLAGRG